MRVATWCIGGVRGHLKVLCHWLERRRPDVVALQKISVSEEKFPTGELLGAGYRSEALRRESLYGVAVLSRIDGPALEVQDRGLAGDDGRDDGLLTVRVGDLLVCCVYAPYGNPSERGSEIPRSDRRAYRPDMARQRPGDREPEVTVGGREGHLHRN